MKRSSRQPKLPRPLPAASASNGQDPSSLSRQLQAALTRLLPRGAVALVVSKGDPALIRSRHCVARHFPCNRQGHYAGYHPGCSTSAIAHLEALRTQGADYLVFPSTAFWWLDHYTAFQRHLADRYKRISGDTDPCHVYSLREAPDSVNPSVESTLSRVITEFQQRWAHEPSILDWQSGLEVAKRLPHLAVFSPPEPGSKLPYLPKSVDFVVTDRARTASAAEARRVARYAVLPYDLSSSVLDIQWQTRPARRHLPSVSLIIPCYNQSHLTDACLRSLFETLPTDSAVEVWVVDDASTDDTPGLLRQWQHRESRLRVIRHSKNRGFGTACNQGARRAQGTFLVFCNNDLVFLPRWLDPLLEVFRSHPRAGAVGGKLLLPDGRLQEAGGVVFCDGAALNFARGEAQLDQPLINFLREVDYCSAALLATRRSLFSQLGGFDRRYSPAYYEDADYCFKVRESGYRVYYQPASAVVHVEGGTSGTDPSHGFKRFQTVNRERFVDRWRHMLHLQPVRPMRVDQTALHALALYTPCSPKRSASARNRRVLVGTAFPPEPDCDSGSRRLWDLMRLLQREGWAVTLFFSGQERDPRYIQLLQQRGIAVFGGKHVKLECLLKAGHFDIAALISWPVAEICLPAIRRLSPNTRILVDSVDLHFLRHARQSFVAKSTQEAPAQLDARFGNDLTRELNVYAAADGVLTVSEREANLLRDLIPQPGLVHVWPDIEQPTLSPAPWSARRGILFTGSFRHAPNLDALEFLCREVIPRLSSELTAAHPLYVVGDPADTDLRSLTETAPNLRLVGWVPSLQPYLNRVRLSVVPLRFGAGTKRKLLASLMAGTPAVSTPVGAEGFGLRDAEHVLIADHPDQFASAIERLLTEPKLWRTLSQNGRAFARLHHSQASVRPRLRSILKSTLQGQPKQSRADQTGSAPQSTRLDLQRYQDLQERIRTHLAVAVPSGSRVLVVSRGDDELLRLGDLRASHFPQAAGGGFAGYHPGDSTAALAHLQALLAEGAEFLLFPQTSFWWLDYYREFADHLRRRHVQVLSNEACVVFRLCQTPPSNVTHPDRRPHRSQPSARPPSSSRPPSAPLALPRKAPNPVGSSPCRTTSNGRCDLVCLPIIEWGFRFQRPQQLLSRSAAAGHRVFYVSQNFRSSDPCCAIQRLLPGVYEVSLQGPSLNVYRDALNEESTRALLSALSALHRAKSVHRAILMVQLPFWWPLAEAARRDFGWPIVYDCMDYHPGFDTNHPRMLDAEASLLSHANLVVASSAPLEAQARRFNSNVLLVRNGCDYEHFAKIRSRTPAHPPVIGYYGAIAHWFDTDLVADLAERRPDWRFLLVGSTHTADVGRLVRLPNVSLPGEQPYAAIPNWLARFDVAIIPFKRNALTESTNPVKAYEILAAGKPLVSTPLPEILDLKPLVQTASTPEDFEHEIEQALQHRGPRLVSQRRVFARQHTWQTRWETLLSQMPAPPTRGIHKRSKSTPRDWPVDATPKSSEDLQPSKPGRTS